MKKAGKIFLLIIIIITGILRLGYLMEPVARNNNQLIDLRIKSGSTSSQIGEKLYNYGLIKSKFLFNLLLMIKGIDDKLQAGFYQLKPSYNLKEVIAILVEGRVATFKVTIPEGYTVEEIAERLATKTPYSMEDFLKIAGSDFAKPYLLAKDSSQKYAVEGFLYPDTYIIPKDYTPDRIFKVILDEFEEKWWERLKLETEDSEYSPYEIMTIASLIEKEAKLEEEKPLIAAVIYNRLEKGMLLQLDASIQYVLPERKERILYRDLEVDSLYNTYRYPGLPPGPVCSPGDSSIEAALNPADVDYLFYFALPDGSHKFSKTYREHLLLQRELRSNNE